LLTISTVYLKAHYLIDTMAALVTLPLFIISGNGLFNLLKKQGQDAGGEQVQGK